MQAYSAVGQEAKANMASASVRKLEAAAEALES